MKTLPAAFAARMERLLGEEYPAYLASYEEKAERSFRINTSKISPQDFDAISPFGTEPIPYVPTGRYLDYDKVGNHPYHHAGMIYVQDPGAMAPAECVATQVKKGKLTLKLVDSKGNVEKEFPIKNENVSTYTLKKDDKYEILAKYDEFEGKIDIKCYKK